MLEVGGANPISVCDAPDRVNRKSPPAETLWIDRPFLPEEQSHLCMPNLTPEQRAREAAEKDDFDFAPFIQRGGLGRAYQLFGGQLPKLLEELNGVLVA